MNIIFLGSGEFALKSLEALAYSHQVILAVTKPDKPQDRHLRIAPATVKTLAAKLGIKTYQPDDPNSAGSLDFLKQFPADLFVVVSYGCILKKSLLELPKLYPLNIHASLLPKYRGAAPINWAIINGEKETGISIIRMDQGMDSGDILLQKAIGINPEDDAETLREKLKNISAPAIIEAVDIIEKREEKFIKQDPDKISLAPKLERKDGLINWNKDAKSISAKIRGLIPWPGAFTYHNGRLIKIWKAGVSEEPLSSPGKILHIRKNAIIVGTGQGAVEISELQPEAGIRMSPEAFICGHKLSPGQILG